MPLINPIQNICCSSEKVPNYPTPAELGFSFAIVIIGGAGAFFLATQTLTPLGITLTTLSGTGALGLTTVALFRRCCGSPYEFAIEDDKEVSEDSFSEDLFEEVDESSSESLSSEASEPEVSETDAESSPEDEPDTVFALCLESLDPYSFENAKDALIAHFRTLSLEEVKSNFALQTRDSAWFSLKDPQTLPPKRVITSFLTDGLIDEFSKDPEWIKAMFAGIGNAVEIGDILARAEFQDSAREAMLDVLRKDDKLIAILIQLHPIALSHVVADLEDSELTKLMSLVLEFNSTSSETTELTDEVHLRHEKIKWIMYRLSDNAWNSFIDSDEKQQDCWKQLEKAFQLLSNASEYDLTLGLCAVLQQLDEALSSSTNPGKEIFLKVVQAFGTTIGKIFPNNSFSKIAPAVGKYLWIEKVNGADFYFPGPLTAFMALELKIWQYADAEEGNLEDNHKAVLLKIGTADVQYVIQTMYPKQLEELINFWKIEDFKTETKETLSQVIKMNANIFAALDDEKREKYYPGYILVIKNLGTKEQYNWLEKEQEYQKSTSTYLITDK